MENLRISFCGDFVSFRPEVAQIGSSVKKILDNSNLRYVNVEAPFSDGANGMIVKSGPSLSQPIKSAELIKQLGFNVISLSNNHIMDYGEIAARETYNCFKGLNCLGLGNAEEAYKASIIEAKGYKIGFVTGCQREFGALDTLDSSKYGYSWINDNRIDMAIINARKECDYVFVCPHAGIEEVEIPLPEWRLRYKHFIDIGADAVIASHPHIIQGREDYNGRRIYYSLGNFFFDRPSMPICWDKGMIVTVNIDKCGVAFEENFVERNNGMLDLIDYAGEFKRVSSYLGAVLYSEKLKELIKLMAPIYDKNYAFSNSSPLGNKTLRGFISWARRALLGYRDDIRLINLIRCESHRWMYLHCLNYRTNNKY